MSKTYYSVDGVIIGEHRSGETSSRDYLHDHLGNVVAVFQDDWEIGMASYDPSGEFLTNWNMSDYRFAWNGAHGYRSTGLEWSSHYVRARHYSFMDGAWTTRDPLWPNEMPYGYVEGMAMSRIDPSGMDVHPGTRPSGGVGCTPAWNAYIYEFCNSCSSHSNALACYLQCDQMARSYHRACGKPKPGPGAFLPPNNKRGPVAPRFVPPSPIGPPFVPGWDPVSFQYGNCCGQTKKCNCFDITSGRALDCLDKACARHDDCLGGTVQSVINGLGPCDLQLYNDLTKCDCNTMYTHPMDRENCETAKFRMMNGFILLGVGAGPIKRGINSRIQGIVNWGNDTKIGWPFSTGW
ncbi:MAG: hypothetical protein KF824_01770 [Fimbriimonadaceae bacterium]|nr:MAG: hypothetical protein KF824_01770 [Fimbriimonadaceae bacterium]